MKKILPTINLRTQLYPITKSTLSNPYITCDIVESAHPHFLQLVMFSHYYSNYQSDFHFFDFVPILPALSFISKCYQVQHLGITLFPQRWTPESIKTSTKSEFYNVSFYFIFPLFLILLKRYNSRFKHNSNNLILNNSILK